MTSYQKEFVSIISTMQLKEVEIEEEEVHFLGFTNAEIKQSKSLKYEFKEKIKDMEVNDHDSNSLLEIDKTEEELSPHLFQCAVCYKYFYNQDQCKLHLKSHSETEGVTLCNICGLVLSCKKEFIEHSIEKHNSINIDSYNVPTLYECGLCPEIYDSADELIVHFESHSEKECEICGKSFTYEKAFSSHLQKHFTDGEYENTNKCSVCNKTFLNLHSLKNHMRNHSKSSHLCTVCGKRIKNITDFKYHMASHEGEKPIKCKYCKYRCLKPSNMKAHVRLHTGEMPYQCDKCGGRFSYKTAFNNHVATHAVDKLLTCSYCGKNFVAKSILVAHERIHTGEKPFKCDVCNRSFTVRSTLKKHMSVHSKSHPFFCSTCSRSFKLESSLDLHLLSHDQERHLKTVEVDGIKIFECKFCGKQSKTHHNAQRHLKIHTGKKPYNCTVCKRNFTEKSSLVGHMRMHNDERPFTCDLCGYQFRDKSVMRRHIKRKHTVATKFEIFDTSSEELKIEEVIIHDNYLPESLVKTDVTP